MSGETVTDLLNGYVSVCNQALLQNKNRFPFKQILGAAQKKEAQNTIEVRIKNTEAPHHIFKIRESGIAVERHDECTGCNCTRTWIVSKDYIKKVVQDPQAYISNPARIDWNWMYDVKK